MKKTIGRVIQWNNRLLVDVVFSIVEAVVVLVISYLYLIVLSFNYGLGTEDVNFFDAFRHAVSSTMHPTEMITYVTGVLSSTTAYFVVRLVILKTHIKRVLFILLATAILFWIATPLFISGLQGAPVNQAFAVGIAKIVGVGAVCIWLFSLFSQRRIFERGFEPDGDRRGKEIAKNVGSF